MFMFHFIRKSLKTAKHHPRLGGLEILKYIGPGLLVTVGFIDPGNWASNLAAGADYGYTLLWMVSLSTVMLIILQHNVAHLGIATGLCLSEATMTYIRPKYAKMILWTAMGASVSTSLAEILGGAIALEMLFGIPVRIGAILTTVFVCIMLFYQFLSGDRALDHRFCVYYRIIFLFTNCPWYISIGEKRFSRG